MKYLIISLSFLSLFNTSIKSKPQNNLLIVPFGKIEKENLNFLGKELQKYFDFSVKISGPEPLPEYAFNSKRAQYYSSKILRGLDKFKTQAERILGIIDRDLYVTGLNFVFGEADIRNNICIISLTRLRQEYYSFKADRRLFLERTLKEAIHELGHTYGLRHCNNPRCIMHFSNSLRDTDIKGPDFCPICKKRLNLR
jgi:archaemetzincin